MRKLFAVLAVVAMILTAAPLAASPYPDVIDLPEDYFPEGIAIGKGASFYVGALSDGSVYKGDLRTGEGDVLVPPFGPFTTVGIEIDGKERIWVAGGPSGTGRVYDGRTGAELAVYRFTAPFASFINDVVVTNDAAYFTDSGSANPSPGLSFAGEPRLFKVPLGKGQSLPGAGAVAQIPVDAPDVFFPNLNGIVTTPGGGNLIVGHTVGEVLFLVDPETGDATQIDVGGVPLIGNDGLDRRGNVVYVVENSISQITAVKLSADGLSGDIVATYSVDGAETPTTAGLFGNALYAVDARFGSMAGPYRVFRVDLN